MAGIKLANGKEVKELRIWNGLKWVAKTGKVWNRSNWVGFIRPGVTFKDDFMSIDGMVKQTVSENAGVVANNKILFDTQVSYSVTQNLMSKFYDWVYIHSFATIVSEYSLEVRADAGQRWSHTLIDVVQGKTYRFSIKEVTGLPGWFILRNGVTPTETYRSVTFSRNATYTFVANSNSLMVKLSPGGSTVGTVLFEDIELVMLD